MTEAENSTSTEIIPVERRAVLALDSDKTASRIAEEVAKTADIVACNDKPGRELVHKAAMRHRDIRLSIQRASSAAREDAVALQKAVIAEEKRLVSLVQPEEDRLISIRDGFDAEQERIRQAAIQAEQERVRRMEMEMAMYRDIPINYVQSSSAEIALGIEKAAGAIPALEYKGDEEQRMQAYRAGAIAKLEEMKAAAEAREEAERQAAEARSAEEARIKAEREAEALRQRLAAEELARQQAELKRQQEEAAAARAKAEAEAAEQRRKQEEELAAQREQMARERAALEAERAKAAEALREAEAKQAEIERQREEAEKAVAPVPEVVDTRPVITVELEPADDTPPPAPEAPPTLRLGQISERLGFTVTAEFLLSLGFAHSGTDKAAKLFHESEFKPICAALIRHISAVSAKA